MCVFRVLASSIIIRNGFSKKKFVINNLNYTQVKYLCANTKLSEGNGNLAKAPHIPVMKDEILNFLCPKDGQVLHIEL